MKSPLLVRHLFISTRPLASDLAIRSGIHGQPECLLERDWVGCSVCSTGSSWYVL